MAYKVYHIKDGRMYKEYYQTMNEAIKAVIKEIGMNLSKYYFREHGVVRAENTHMKHIKEYLGAGNSVMFRGDDTTYAIRKGDISAPEGIVFKSNCCSVDMHDWPDSDLCPLCLEHCDVLR